MRHRAFHSLFSATLLPILWLIAGASAGLAAPASAGDVAYVEPMAGIVEDAAALRASWIKAFAQVGSAKGGAGEPVTFSTFTLNGAVMGRDIRVAVLRVGSRYSVCEAWVPAFNAVLPVDEIKPATTVGAGDEQRIREAFTITMPKRVTLEEQDAQLAFTVTLKPGGPAMSGTYQVRIGTADKSGAATLQSRPLGSGDAFPADYPAFKAAGKTVPDICLAATELEQEVCRRYRDIMWVEAEMRGLPRKGIPGYPAPSRIVPQVAGPGGKTAGKKESAGGLDDFGEPEGLAPEVLKRAETVAKIAAPPPKASAPVTAESMKEIREHVASICAAVERFLASGAKSDSVVSASAPCADPLFGPWYGFAPLTSEKGRANILPAGVGGPGRQEWRHVDNWQVLGPVPLDAPSPRCVSLPHRFFLPGAVYQIFKEYLPRPKKTEEKADDAVTPEPDSSPQDKAIEAGMRWMSCGVDPGTGILRVPQWYTASGSGYGSASMGLAKTTWFSATEINADADCEVWVAMGADDDAQVWINGRLVAAWPDTDRRDDMESPIMFRMSFRKGRNVVTARIRQLDATSCLWMKVCTQGAPDPAATSAREKMAGERQRNLRPFGPEVRGWRGNWLGVAPEAKPVTAWDWDKRINVKWSIGLPPTISSPLVVGDRIFTTSTPHNLFCVDKTTGKLLWRATFDLLDVLEPAIAAQAKPINDAQLDLQAQVFHRAEGPPGDSTETVKDGDKSIPIREAAQRCRELSMELHKMVEGGLKKHRLSLNYLWSGHMWAECATPVTDGKHIWLRSASGVAACFTIDGERKWLVEVPHRSSAYNAFSSPLLVDGLFIVEVVPDDNSRSGGGWRGCEWRDVVLLALDATTGKERWRTPVLNPIGTSSPIAMRITDGKEDMAVVVIGGSGTARLLKDGRFQPGFLGGTVVRVSDGKVLIGNMSVNTGYGTAVATGDIVYHCGLGQMTATRLIMVDRDTLGAKRLWTMPFSRGLEPCMSPLDGRLFANVAIGAVGGQGHAGYVILDAATGIELPRHVNVDWPMFTGGSAWGSAGRCYIPTAVAGPVIFLADEGEGFGGKVVKGALSVNPYANCVAVEAKEQGRLIAQNALPPRSNSALLFDGDRMYYRNTFGMACIGYTGEEGQAFEAEVNARFVMEDLDLEQPATGAAVAIAPQSALPEELPRQDNSIWTRFSRPFLTLGPIKSDQRPGVMDALNGKVAWAKGVVEPKVPFAHDPGRFTESRLRKYGRVAMVAQSGFEVYRAWEGAGKPAGRSTTFATVVQIRRPMTVRFIKRTESPRVRAWLGGVELKHQQRYRIEPGEYAYLGEMDFGEASDDVRLDYYFVRSADDPEQDVKDWQEDLRGAKAYLERVVKLKPDCDTGKRAKEVLARMK